MLYLNEDDVRALLPMPQALDLVESGFRHLAEGQAQNRPRQRVVVPGGAVLHVMAGADTATGYLGLKVYSTSREGARFLVLLYRAQTGEPLAQIEADYLGQVRTGAASGVASRYMARDDARVLAVIGTGKQAFTQALAIAEVRDLEEIRVYGRDEERRGLFAGRLQYAGQVTTHAVAGAREAVRGAHIVVTATTSRDPVLLGDWLEDGMHINAIGSNNASRSELDEAAVRRAALIATDSLEQARIESGELLWTFRDSERDWGRVVELSRIVSGAIPGRQAPSDVTLFKSNGIALEDIVVAGWLYEQALDRGLGKRLPVLSRDR